MRRQYSLRRVVFLDELQRHLDFRDYLTVHPEDAEAYARLRMELARKFPTDIEGYCAGKDGMIKEIDAKAKAWRENQAAAQ